MQRLQKFLASAGFGSRRKSEEIIKQGRVRLNDAQAKLGDKVGELDKVYVDGNLIESIAQPTRIIMLNKQRGVICSKNPQQFSATVFDNLPEQMHIGMTEIEICNIFKKQLIEKGADHTLYMSCASGQGGYDQIICDPSD